MIDIDYVLEVLQAVEPKTKTAEALWKLGFDAYFRDRQEWASVSLSRERIAVSRRCFRSGLRNRVADDHSGFVIDLFVGDLDLVEVGFRRTLAAGIGRPVYYPHLLLNLVILDHLNCVPPSHRLGREAGRMSN